jgi:hypothetical protein
LIPSASRAAFLREQLGGRRVRLNDDQRRRLAVKAKALERKTLAHTERNHQGLDNALIFPDAGHAVVEGRVHRRERLGWLLNYYYRKAA